MDAKLNENIIFENNEEHANGDVSKILLYSALVCLVVIGLSHTDIIKTPADIILRDFGLSAVILMLAYGSYFLFKALNFYKYIAVFAVLSVVFILYSDFNIHTFVFIAWFIPPLVTAIYFNLRFTLLTCIVVIVSINFIDFYHGASLFTPVVFLNGKNQVAIENPDLIADSLFIDIGLSILTFGFLLIVHRSKTLLINLADAGEEIRRSRDELEIRVIERTAELNMEVEARIEAQRLSEALNKINMAISSTLDFDLIMKRVVVDAGMAIGAETAMVALREDSGWVGHYVYEMPDDRISIRFSDEEVPHAVLAAQTRQPVVIHDALSDDRTNHEIMSKYNVRSMLVMPLILRDTVLGVIFFNQHSQVKPFNPVQVNFARRLAASISLAMENARLYAAERNIADTLQEVLLSVPEELEKIEFAHLYHSATEAAEVGGDFYDLFMLAKNHVGLLIGDVSGKGLDAASLTSVVKNTIKAYAFEEESPGKIIAKTNEVLSRTLSPSVFITLCFAVLNLDSGLLTFCSAGHPPTIIKRKNGPIEMLPPGSPAIGISPGWEFNDGHSQMNLGDILLFYTDGVIEARQNSHFFGEDGLIKFLESWGEDSAKLLPQAILERVMEYSKGAIGDDIALLAVTRTE